MLFISRKAPDSRAAQRLTMERILTLPRFMAFLLSYHVFEEITMEKAGKCTKKRFVTESWGKSSLGERVCGRAKLLAGTLRCLRLCWRLPWDWSDAEQLGRCPKPHKGRCPLTLQGAIAPCPLFAIELVVLSRSFRVQLFGASPKPLFAPQTFREEPKRDSEFPPSLWGCEITSRSERIRQRCGRRRPCRSVRCRPDGSSRGCRRSLRPQHTGQESRCRFHPAPAHSR